MFKKALYSILFSVIIIFPVLVLAQTPAATEEKKEDSITTGIKFKPSIDIPGSIFTEEIIVNGDTLPKYIVAVYRYGGIFAGIVAMFMLVYAGWEWLLAGGNSSKISSARDKINGTLIGLALLFGGYILLSLISTSLIKFNSLNTALPDMSKICPTIMQEESCTKAYCVWAPPTAEQLQEAPAITGYCKDAASAACASEALVKDFSIPKFTEDGQCSDCRLTIETINALQRVSAMLSNNETITIKSAFRTTAKQAELYACYKSRINANLCSSNCTSCEEASPPSCESAHQTGTAVDVCMQVGSFNSCGYTKDGQYYSYLKKRYNCSGPSDCPPGLFEVQDTLRRIMEQAGFDRYDGEDGEWWHFQFKGQP